MTNGDEDSDSGEDGEIWEEEGGFLVISTDKGGSEIISRVDVAVSTTSSTLAEAVDKALETRNFHNVYELIEGGHSVNQVITDNGSSLLHRAAKYGCLGFTQNLLRLGAVVGAERVDGVTPLLLAAQEGHVEIVKALLGAEAKVDTGPAGYTPLYLACQQGHIRVAKELLKGGANPNNFLHSSGLTPLHSACFRGSDQLVRLLLQNGANPEAVAM